MGETGVAIVEKAEFEIPDCAGRAHHGREAVYRDEEERLAGRLSLIEPAGDRLVQRLMDFHVAAEAFAVGQVRIDRNDGPVALRHEAVRRFEGTVAVDDEPAVSLQDERCIEGSEMPRATPSAPTS